MNIKNLAGAMFFLLMALYFGNEALIRFQSGQDLFGMIISLLIALGSTIAMGNFIKKINKE